MHPQIQQIRKTRTWLVGLIEGLSMEELNKIPPGFNNNIIWNVAHLPAAQQNVCYVRAGLHPVIEEKYFIRYKPETKPEVPADENEVNDIKQLLFSSLDQLELDLQKNIFINYPSWKTRSGVEINNIEDGLKFLSFHEGIHTGYVMALKRIIK